jgi:hypothetical protein
MLTYMRNMGACRPYVVLYSPLRSNVNSHHLALFTLRTRLSLGVPEELIGSYYHDDVRGA